MSVPAALERMPAALAELEKRSWHDLWRTAVEDAVYEQRIELARFGAVQATIVACTAQRALAQPDPRRRRAGRG